MYKNEPFFDIEYEEVGSENPKNSLFDLHIPPIAYIIKKEVQNFRIHPVVKDVAKTSGTIVAMIIVKTLSLSGQLIWIVLMIIFHITFGLITGLRDTYREGIKTPFETDIKTPVKTDWRDIPTGQNRHSRQPHKRGGDTYINIIHNY